MLPITNTTSARLLMLTSGFLVMAFSVSWTRSDGYAKRVPSIISVAAAILSVWVMSLTLRVIPVGTAYVARTRCIGLVVAGTVGLQLQAPV